MGLCLCIFNGDDELDGVEVGKYRDFGAFRDAVCSRLEHGRWASRFPVLMSHSDCDGSWSPDEARALDAELQVIGDELALLPPMPLPDDWQQEVARTFGLHPANLGECFFDVDGEPLVERLRTLCRCAMQHGLPVLFQ